MHNAPLTHLRIHAIAFLRHTHTYRTVLTADFPVVDAASEAVGLGGLRTGPTRHSNQTRCCAGLILDILGKVAAFTVLGFS
jgi:hypothetical protein